MNEETTVQNDVDIEKIWKAVEDLQALVISMNKDKSCSHNNKSSHNNESSESDSRTNEMINAVKASKGKQLITDYFSSPETSHQKAKDKENNQFITDSFKPVNRTVIINFTYL